MRLRKGEKTFSSLFDLILFILPFFYSVSSPQGNQNLKAQCLYFKIRNKDNKLHQVTHKGAKVQKHCAFRRNNNINSFKKGNKRLHTQQKCLMVGQKATFKGNVWIIQLKPFESAKKKTIYNIPARKKGDHPWLQVELPLLHSLSYRGREVPFLLNSRIKYCQNHTQLKPISAQPSSCSKDSNGKWQRNEKEQIRQLVIFSPKVLKKKKTNSCNQENRVGQKGS